MIIKKKEKGISYLLSAYAHSEFIKKENVFTCSRNLPKWLFCMHNTYNYWRTRTWYRLAHNLIMHVILIHHIPKLCSFFFLSNYLWRRYFVIMIVPSGLVVGMDKIFWIYDPIRYQLVRFKKFRHWYHLLSWFKILKYPNPLWILFKYIEYSYNK